MKKNNIRQTNIELFRIVLMMLIVAHHYFVNSGLSEVVLKEPSAYTYLYEVLGMWGKTGINCFVLITGYFMVNSNTSPLKFIKLLAEVLFYNIIIYLLFCVTGYTNVNIKGIVKNIFPIVCIKDNFTGCYLVFYLLIPFINILLKNVNKQQHKRLIVVLLFAYTFIGSIPKFGTSLNYVSWFTVVYIIGAYIKLYFKSDFKLRTFISLLISVLFSVLSVIAMTYIWIKYRKGEPYFFVADSNKIFAVTTSITLFLFFLNLHIKQSKFINTIAASTFGVLCIHANSDLMRQWLWQDSLKNVAFFQLGGGYGLGHYLFSVILVFTVCTIIDIIRIRLIEKPFIKKINRISWLENWNTIIKHFSLEHN